jgi:hypothetical protein
VAAGAETREDDKLTGSWLATVTIDGGVFPPFHSLLGFASGGVLTTVNADGTPAGLGTWMSTGESGFAFTFLAPDTDQNNKPTGGLDKIRGTGKHTGNHISGKFKVNGFDGSGNPTFSATGTFDGTRVAVEPL